MDLPPGNSNHPLFHKFVGFTSFHSVVIFYKQSLIPYFSFKICCIYPTNVYKIPGGLTKIIVPNCFIFLHIFHFDYFNVIFEFKSVTMSLAFSIIVKVYILLVGSIKIRIYINQIRRTLHGKLYSIMYTSNYQRQERVPKTDSQK